MTARAGAAADRLRAVIRVFLDANILFSAAYRPDSGLLRLWDLADVELVVTSFVLLEAKVNLDDEEQHERPEDLARRCTLAAEVGEGDARHREHHGLPEKARPVLWSAIDLECQYLVTGDKRHFGRLMGRTTEGVKVVLARDLLKVLDAGASGDPPPSR